MRAFPSSALAVLAVLGCGLRASEPGAIVVERDADLEHLVLSEYETLRPSRPDPVAAKAPWVLEVSLASKSPIEPCSGWLVQASVPDSWRPPYHDSNHHFEYWGVVGKTKRFLGRGEKFALVQDIELSSFRDFIADACRAIPHDEALVATAYLRLALAGRYKLESKDSSEAFWRWVNDYGDIAADWLHDCNLSGGIPPRHVARSDRVTFCGCFLLETYYDQLKHTDVGCWEFQFAESAVIREARQLYRRQSKHPGYSSDMKGAGLCDWSRSECSEDAGEPEEPE